MILILQTLVWADCSNWNGLASLSHPILEQTKSLSLLVEEELSLNLQQEDCVVDAVCSWSLSNDSGSLELETGLENTYFAPTSLDDCEIAQTVLTVSCLNEEETLSDKAEISITCGEVDPSNPSFWEASGGGCNSPTYAYIFLLPLFSLVKRRRSSVKR